MVCRKGGSGGVALVGRCRNGHQGSGGVATVFAHSHARKEAHQLLGGDHPTLWWNVINHCR